MTRPDPGGVAVSIARAAIKVCAADRLTRAALAGLAIGATGRPGAIRLLGVGKCAHSMVSACRDALGERVGSYLAVVPPDHQQLDPLHYLPGDHPFPAEQSADAAARVERFLAEPARGPAVETVLVAVSGGTSAMLAAPVPPLSMAELNQLHRLLLLSGRDVSEINRLRAAASRLHGGRLVALAGAAEVIGLILSDNAQMGAEAVGSGLTYPSFLDLPAAAALIEQLELDPALLGKLRTAVGNAVPAPCRPVHNVTLGTPQNLLDAAVQAATRAGFQTFPVSGRIDGEARQIAARFGALLTAAGPPAGRRAWIAAGEAVVRVPTTAAGTGGRCQELALAMAEVLDGRAGAEFAAVASDGQDFVPGVAGGMVDWTTAGRLRRAGVDWRVAMREHDSWRALSATGGLVTGHPPATNLCDVYVLCEQADAA